MEYGDSILDLFRKDQSRRLIRKPLNCLTESASIREAIQSMIDQETDYVCIVSNEKRFRGLITEQLILQKIATNSLDEKASVTTIMSTEWQCCIDMSEPISNIVMSMYKNQFMHIPIMEQGKVVGVVSVRDFVSYLTDYFAESIYTLIPDQPEQKRREGA